jgi:hypothetical protein
MATGEPTVADLMRVIEEMRLRQEATEAAWREEVRLRAEAERLWVEREAKIANEEIRIACEAYQAKEQAAEALNQSEEVHTEVHVESTPIEKPPPPFHIKAIPDDIVQDSLVFKCGVLAKWHVDNEVIETTPPPLYTDVQVEILSFVYGGEGVKGGHSSWKKKSLDEGSMLAMCFKRCCPMRRVLNEWVKEWSVHSGKFKLLG